MEIKLDYPNPTFFFCFNKFPEVDVMHDILQP